MERNKCFHRRFDYHYSNGRHQAATCDCATREAYKRCGKDPGRYRPSAEALRRRLMRGIPLYQIDTLVDLINLVSLRTGHSIGGFDADKIQGNRLELGIGKAEEPFEGIGRGAAEHRRTACVQRFFGRNRNADK